MQSKALKKIIRNPTAVICIVILAVLIVSCVFSDVLAPYGFDEQQLHNARQGPSDGAQRPGGPWTGPRFAMGLLCILSRSVSIHNKRSAGKSGPSFAF